MSTCSTVQFINIYGSKISNSYILDGSYCTKSKMQLNPISNPLDFTVIYPGQLAFAHFEPLELRKLGQIFFPLGQIYRVNSSIIFIEKSQNVRLSHIEKSEAWISYFPCQLYFVCERKYIIKVPAEEKLCFFFKAPPPPPPLL